MIAVSTSSLRIGAHGLGRGFHRLLVARGEGAQGVLHAVAELSQHRVRNVERVLGDEIHAHALGADQAHHLFDLFEQGLGRVVEQQVRLVEEEHQLGLFRVAHLGQVLEQFGQHPQEEGRVQLGRAHQDLGGEDVDHAAAFRVGLHQVVDIERGLAEELVRPLLFELHQAALDGADRGRRYVAVLGGEIARRARPRAAAARAGPSCRAAAGRCRRRS